MREEVSFFRFGSPRPTLNDRSLSQRVWFHLVPVLQYLLQLPIALACLLGRAVMTFVLEPLANFAVSVWSERKDHARSIRMTQETPTPPVITPSTGSRVATLRQSILIIYAVVNGSRYLCGQVGKSLHTLDPRPGILNFVFGIGAAWTTLVDVVRTVFDVVENVGFGIAIMFNVLRGIATVCVSLQVGTFALLQGVQFIFSGLVALKRIYQPINASNP